MYTHNQQKVIARPRSSLLAEENRSKNCQQKSADSRLPTATLTLLALCIFLFVLCACTVTFLVLVGRKFSSPPIATTGDTLPQLIQDNRSISSDDARTIGIDRNSKINGVKVSANQSFFKPKVVFRPSEILHEVQFTPSGNKTQPADSGDTMTTGATKIMSAVIPHLSFRLPKEILPRHYELFLHPKLDKKTFSGTVAIRVDVLRPITFMPVHSKGLTIANTKAFKLSATGESKSIDIVNTFEYEPFEYWVTEFAKELEVGEYHLKLAFSGKLTDRIVGFYESSYFDKKSNQTRWIATSKFEPTYARQAFPCFDEPAMKAKFSVTLGRPSDDSYIALSNMNQIEEVKEGDVIKVKFAESVEMSTYLACFIVCDFDFKQMEVNSNAKNESFDMRVYATKSQINKVDFALNTGVNITEYYIGYFGLRYPLPKLDMIAIPDFVSGAMEHWGLVTFRETALLYDKSSSSTANKERVAGVVAHELAHMWFGNLVTMKWWNDLWLNEGFATYMTNKGVDNAYPDWKMMDRFIIDTMHGVMDLDATLAAHPIVQTVENPDQITELFDSITYSKGASIIRMLEEYVGPEKFRQSVSQYLEKYQYKNAETDDFLTEVESLNPNSDVKFIMETWTRQMGIPVVQVDKISETEYVLKQKRFLSNPEDYFKDQIESPFNYKWAIPITYSSNEESEVQRRLFKIDDGEVKITLNKPAKWIKLNKNQVGYYRVNYEEEIWGSLIQELQNSTEALDVSDRAHLLNDAFALANAEQLSYDIALNLTTYLKSETQYVPWSVAASELIFLKHILSRTDISEEFLKYSRDLVKDTYKSIEWTVGENHLENLLRVSILSLACSLELPECVDKAAEKFNEWLQNPSVHPNPDIRSIVYSYGMKYTGNEAKWNQVWNLFKKEADANEKLKLMSSLSTIQNPTILTKFIDLAWDESNVRGQDYFSCLQNIASNPVGEPLVWDYVRGHWEDLAKRFGLNDRYLGRLIPAITKGFSTTVKLEEMEAFFKKYPDAGAGAAARKQALATVNNNIKWLKANKAKVSDWLKTKTY